MISPLAMSFFATSFNRRRGSMAAETTLTLLTRTLWLKRAIGPPRRARRAVCALPPEPGKSELAPRGGPEAQRELQSQLTLGCLPRHTVEVRPDIALRLNLEPFDTATEPFVRFVTVAQRPGMPVVAGERGRGLHPIDPEAVVTHRDTMCIVPFAGQHQVLRLEIVLDELDPRSQGAAARGSAREPGRHAAQPLRHEPDLRGQRHLHRQVIERRLPTPLAFGEAPWIGPIVVAGELHERAARIAPFAAQVVARTVIGLGERLDCLWRRTDDAAA